VRSHAPVREYGTFLEDGLSVLNVIRSSDEHTVTWLVKLSDVVCTVTTGPLHPEQLQRDVHCHF
jgi:hypothetical protein